MQPAKNVLRMVAIVYACLYLVFLIIATIPATRSAIFSNAFHASFRLEQTLTYLLFANFAIGLFAWFHSELVAGLIFLSWFALVLWAERFSIRFGMGGGSGPLLGLPGLLFGLVLVYRSLARIFRNKFIAPE